MTKGRQKKEEEHGSNAADFSLSRGRLPANSFIVVHDMIAYSKFSDLSFSTLKYILRMVHDCTVSASAAAAENKLIGHVACV